MGENIGIFGSISVAGKNMNSLFSGPTVCDVTTCDEEAKVIDEMGNFLCEECMNDEVEESGTTAEDYESI